MQLRAAANSELKRRTDMLSAMKKPRGNDLLSRLEWILETRNWTHEQFSYAAGFESRSQFSMIVSRLRKDPSYAGRMSVDQYRALAKGAHVSLMWLVSGAENHGEVIVRPSARFPNLRAVVEESPHMWSQFTIAAASAVPFESDLSKSDWIEFLDDAERQLVETYRKHNNR